MWWAYPLPPGIGGIIIVLMILAIPQVPMGIGVGLLIAVGAEEILRTGQMEMLALGLCVIPALLLALILPSLKTRTRKRPRKPLDEFELRLIGFNTLLPFTTIIGCIIYSFFNPIEKQWIYIKDIPYSDADRIRAGLDAYTGAYEAYHRGWELIPLVPIEIFFGVVLTLVLLGLIEKHTKKGLKSRRSS